MKKETVLEYLRNVKNNYQEEGVLIKAVAADYQKRMSIKETR